MKKGLLAMLALIILLGGMLVGKYNSLVRLDNDVEAAYGQVQVVIKRRADLIPNLVNTVKGYAEHESETFKAITQARSKVQNASTPAELAKADSQLTNAISRLNVVVENYPDLKANQNFLDLQAQLEGTENRISTERGRYNEAIKLYNKKVRSFPMNIFAGMFGFERKEFFEASPEEQNAPEVNF